MAVNVSTIAKLREYLNQIESTWTDQDTEHMGEFGLTSVNVWVDGKGYAPAIAFIDVDGSIIFDVDKPRTSSTVANQTRPATP